MNDQEFNSKLKRMAPDLRLLWNPRKRLWGIYQVRSSHFVNAWDAPISAKPWLLFDIKDDQGQFRAFDERDLRRAASSIYSAHTLWEKGGDKYADLLEEKERRREELAKEQVDDTVRQAAKEAKFHFTVVSPRRVTK